MSEIILYQTPDNKTELEVKFDGDTVWLTQYQLAELFQGSRTNIVEHIKNIYKTAELDEDSTCRKFRQVQKEGKRTVERQIDHYNLDVIISVGYRINSKRGTQFRRWATQRLKDYLVKGYAVNEKRLREKSKQLDEIKKTINLISRVTQSKELDSGEATGLLNIISDYSYALDLLDEYDFQKIKLQKTAKQKVKRITYSDAKKIVNDLKKKFHTSSLFGNEKDNSFKSAIETIYQTFNKKELYPGIEQKASMLLYLVIKNHPFIDGNKRIAASIFIWFLALNKFLYNNDGSKKIADNALVAICLMIASSNPKEKDLIVKLLVKLMAK